MRRHVKVMLGAVAVVLLLPGTATAAAREPVWVQHLDVPDPELYSMPQGNALDPVSGNVFVTGYRCPRALCNRSVALTAAYSPSGGLLWQALYDGPGLYDATSAIAVDPASGTVVVTGTSIDAADQTVATTIAYSSTGEQLWVASYGDTGIVNGIDVVVDSRLGRVYVGAQAGSGYVTLAYDLVGTQLWAATYDGSGAEPSSPRLEGLAIDTARGTVVASGTEFVAAGGDYDVATVAYSPAGQELWAARYDGPSGRDDYGVDVDVDPRAGRYYVVGYTKTATRTDVLTVAYDPAGNQLWSDTYDGPAHDFEAAQDIGVDSRTGRVYVIGDSANRRNNDYDWVTLAYTAGGERLWANRYGGPRNDTPNVVTVNRATGRVLVAGIIENIVTVVTYSAAGAQQGITSYADAPTTEPIDSVVGLLLDVPRRQAYLTFESYGPDGERPVGITTVAYAAG